MAKTKDGTQFDIKTGEVLETIPIPSERRVEVTTSYGKKRVRVRQFNNDPSKTDPSQAQFTDINYIMRGQGLREYNRLPEHAKSVSDLSNFTDLHGAYHAVQEAEAAFMQMPAKIRSQFQNDPRKLHAFLNDPKNNEEAIYLGLKEKPLESFQDYKMRSSQKPSNDRETIVEEAKAKPAQAKQKSSTPSEE